MKKDEERSEDTYQRDTYGGDRKQEEKIKKEEVWINDGNKKNLKEKKREISSKRENI